jgi:3-oxoacyl-[acyl-carrier-protein] synthase III
MTAHSAIIHASVHVPAARQTAEEAEDRFRAESGINLTRGVLNRMYGLNERAVAPHDDRPSDIAAQATRVLFDEQNLKPSDVDLLLFTGISTELQEPATAHVVADKLGLTCPVFDLNNACNGVLNGLEVADAFIRAGQYRRILVTTAELSTRMSRYRVDRRADVLSALPSLSLGDMGSAVLVEASDRPGIQASRFFTNSAAWSTATLPNPYVIGKLGEFVVDSAALTAAYADMPAQIRKAMSDLGIEPDDLDLVCMHQPSVAFAKIVRDWIGVDDDRWIEVFSSYGNVATNAVPLQLATALQTGRLRRGDLVGMFGAASGVSAGFVICEW